MERVVRRLAKNAFPAIGARPVGEIEPDELLAKVLRPIEKRGAHEIAHRVAQSCGQAFRYAVATGRARRDPTADLRGALTPVDRRHFPAITEPKAIGALLRAIDGYQGAPVVRHALRLLPYVFTRPGELRGAVWSAIDLEHAQWEIPAERMKMRSAHVVPLAQQAVAILEELLPLSGPSGLVFPGLRSRRRPLSDNTLNAALRRLGYGPDEMVAHGFRAMASTLLHGLGVESHLIEKQLAHRDRNSTRAVYNHQEYLPQRRKLMQSWGDYLDALRAGGERAAAEEA